MASHQPLKSYGINRKGSSSNHHFSGAFAVKLYGKVLRYCISMSFVPRVRMVSQVARTVALTVLYILYICDVYLIIYVCNYTIILTGHILCYRLVHWSMLSTTFYCNYRNQSPSPLMLGGFGGAFRKWFVGGKRKAAVVLQLQVPKKPAAFPIKSCDFPAMLHVGFTSGNLPCLICFCVDPRRF